MTETLKFATIMLAAGICVPLLAALNARLGQHIGSPAVAALCLFLVALITAALVVSVTGGVPISQIASAPKHLFLGGSLIAFYVLAITYIAPHFGLGNAVFFVLLGQLISAGLIDHFGLFGAQQVPVSGTRLLGILVMAVGVALTQKG